MCSDGLSYDRVAIEQWLEKHETSPASNEPLKSKVLTPNISLRSGISKLKLPNETKKEKEVEIIVKFVTSDNISVIVDPKTSTVLKVKEKIFYLKGIKPTQQRLIFGGKMLSDDRMLSDYSIVDKSAIHLVLRFLGGV
jgi:hypothetical protein